MSQRMTRTEFECRWQIEREARLWAGISSLPPADRRGAMCFDFSFGGLAFEDPWATPIVTPPAGRRWVSP